MSIWEDCEETGGEPYYGFPVIPTFKNGNILVLTFPKGYKPNGSQTEEVAKQLKKQLGGKVLEVTEKVVKIQCNKRKIADALLYFHMNAEDDSDD